MHKGLFAFGVAAIASLSAGCMAAQGGGYYPDAQGGGYYPNAQGGYYPQGGNVQGSGQGLVRCESRDGRTNRCPTGGGDAQLVRQVSNDDCIRGRTWGTDHEGIWVSQGCRGEFQVIQRGYGGSATGQLFRCESTDNRNRQCAVPSGGDVRLVRQLSSSRCIEGQSWGRGRGSVWVSNGCRAEFQVVAGSSSWNRWRDRGAGANGDGYASQQTVVCESRDDRTTRCGANIRRGAELVRQLSSSACVEGRSWGWDGGGIWVSGGCRGEFRVW